MQHTENKHNCNETRLSWRINNLDLSAHDKKEHNYYPTKWDHNILFATAVTA